MKYEGDPYQTEYAAIQDVEILREGNWNWEEHERQMLEELVLTYDPGLLRAKVIKDHRYQEEAYGHVLKLFLDDVPGDKGVVRVIATTGFLPEGKAMIDSGKYNERSVGYAYFYPTSGFPYLWEFSLLGANTPAVTGMQPIIFKEEESGQMIKQFEAEREMAKMNAGKPEGTFSWQRDDEYIKYQVRNKSRFATELRKVELDREAGIFAKVGQLRPEYITEGGNEKSKVMQEILFDLQMGWSLAKAKDWIGQRQLTAMSVTIASVVPYGDLPLADEDVAWDNKAAEARRREWAGGEDNIDWDKYRKAYIWYDSEDKENFSAYKLPIGDVIDGILKAVPRGIFAAAGAVSGARGGVDIPDADMPGVKGHLEKYYEKMDRKAPWQEESQNNSPEGVENRVELITLTQGGRSAMAEKPDEKGDGAGSASILVVEVGSPIDLAKKNIELREAKERAEQDAQARLIAENDELRKQVTIARGESIKSRVRTMQADGFITQAQVDMGLTEALATIPDKAIVRVGDKERRVVDILVEALKYGGKLKLKLEIAKDILTGDIDDPLAKARAAGVDTSVEERRIQLMKENPKLSHGEALDQATLEVKGR